MKTYYECIPCFVNQALTALKTIKEPTKEILLRKILQQLSKIDFSLSPPEMARIIFDVIEEHLPNKDFYYEIKQRSNKYILALEDEISGIIKKSTDPIETAMRLAIAGNIIDFGAKNNFTDDLIHMEMKKAVNIAMDSRKISRLKDEIKDAKKILYLGDNAGEIVFDKLFIKELPIEKITFVVRGKPTINDALIEDAQMVGLTNLLPVISNGDNSPGTVLNRCSTELQNSIADSDFIISKGQGNYETLSEVDKNICFLLKAKCPVIAKDLNSNVDDFIIKFKKEK